MSYVEIARSLILADTPRAARSWPMVAGGSRHLTPVANKPILFHNLEALRDAGVLEAMIVVDGESGPAIRDAVGDGSAWI